MRTALHLHALFLPRLMLVILSCCHAGAAMMAYTIACHAEATPGHERGAAAGAGKQPRVARHGKRRPAAEAVCATTTLHSPAPRAPAAGKGPAQAAVPLPVVDALLPLPFGPGAVVGAGAKPPLAPAPTRATTRAPPAMDRQPPASGHPRTIIETLAAGRVPAHPQPAAVADAAHVTSAAALVCGIRVELERATAAPTRSALAALAARY